MIPLSTTGYVMLWLVMAGLFGSVLWLLKWNADRQEAAEARTRPAAPVNRLPDDPMPPRDERQTRAYRLGYAIGAFRAGLHDAFYGELDDDAEPQDGVVVPSATIATTPQHAIATPQTDSNDPLLRAKVEALAVLVAAQKIGQTDGILKVFGERAGSSNPRYLLIRDLLQKELTRLQPAPQVREPDGTKQPLTRPVTHGA